MENDTRADATLIRRAKTGDRNALGRIYDLYIKRVYRFVYYKVGTEIDAEDVTEQVFVKIITNISRYEERGLPFEAWIFRIARNEVIDYYRRKKVSQVPLEAAVELVDPKPQPEEKVALKLQIEEVMLSLPKLPQSYQDVILLKFVDDMENEEISRVLDKPVDQIRVLQSRALARLRQELGL